MDEEKETLQKSSSDEEVEETVGLTKHIDTDYKIEPLYTGGKFIMLDHKTALCLNNHHITLVRNFFDNTAN
jgi:hypothetical protein